MNARRLITVLSIGISILGLVCTNEKPVAGIEVTNGNCVGTLYLSDGAVADGAVVRLIPGDYNPFSANSPIDSTVTDKNGRFSFMVTELRQYNIIAQKADVSCLDSVELIPNATTIVNDTLRESGSVSGIVRLQKPDTANSIVILVIGTNTFAMPSDTSGTFATPLLAAGVYTLRILSTQSGYAAFDTTVIVNKGAATTLPVIFLPSANAPGVNNFSASLDSLTMYATLRWSIEDTSRIVSYSLRRTTRHASDTLFVIDKSLTTFSDDVLLYDGDTLTYQISANGINFKEGFRSEPRAIFPRQKVRWDKKIATKLGSEHNSDWLLADAKSNLYMGGCHMIQKLDTNGNTLGRYGDSDICLGDGTYDNRMPQADDFGNIYWNEADDYPLLPRIIRFDTDLNKQGELMLYDSRAMADLPLQPALMVTVTGDAKVLVIRDSIYDPATGVPRNDCPRLVTVYDSNFVKLDEYTFQSVGPLLEVRRFGDEFAAKQLFFQSGQQSIGWYDQRFNALSEVHDFGYVNNYLPPQCPTPGSFGGPNELRFTNSSIAISRIIDGNMADKSFSLFVVSTRDKKVIARFMLPVSFSTGRIYFDQTGNFFYYPMLEMDIVNGNYNIVIYRYPMAPLLGAGTP